MGKKAIQLVGVKDDEFYEGMGCYFVELTSRLGYQTLMGHLGRSVLVN